MNTLRRFIVGLLLFPVFGAFFNTGDEGVIDDGEGAPPERPDHVSEEEWEESTEEERRALVMDGTGEEGGYIDGEEDEEEPEETLTEEELAAIAGEGEPAEGEGKTEEGTPAGEKETPPATAPTPTEADFLAYQPQVTAKEIREKLPKFEVPKEIQDQLDSLEDRFENGWEENGEEKTMTSREYNRERDRLNREANEAIANARLDAEDSIRTGLASEKINNAFFTTYPEYSEKEGEGYTIKAEAMFGALEKCLAKVDKDPQHQTKSYNQRLLIAHALVQETFGIKAPVKKVGDDKKTEEKPKVPASDKKGIKTLAHVPAAAENDTVDPFSALDRLSGEALERAIERLNPEQRERYEARF